MYGARQNMARKEETSLLIPKEEEIRIEKNVGVLIYSYRSVDPTIMVALVSIAVKQDKINETTV